MRYLRFVLPAFLLVLSVNVKATPTVYYTFEGTFDYADDSAGIVADAGIGWGDAVSYLYAVDFDRAGESTRNDGIINVYSDYSSYDYFYVDLISASYLTEKDGGAFNADRYAASHNYGFSYYGNASTASRGAITQGRLISGSDDQFQQLYWSGDISISTMLIGQVVKGYEEARDSSGQYSGLSTNLTLTNISEQLPVNVSAVPVPAAAWLFGSALLGFFGFSRRKANA